MIKISIIVPSYNQGQFLEDTFISIINQNYPSVEIIVMDGGSTDNSVEVIKKYEKYITYWQSKKDNGQSDAINQGFRRATGEIVTWLNSDDVLLPGTLQEVNKYATKYPKTQWFLGNVLWLNKYGDIIRIGKVENESLFWNSRHLFSNGGPTAFMRRERLIEIGALREDFHYMMDTELWHRFISKGDLFVRIQQYCWGLRLHENAKMSGHNFKDSKLADKNHPSWNQKKKEDQFINNNYPISASLKKVWSYYRILGIVIISRFTDKHMLNHNYKEL